MSRNRRRLGAGLAIAGLAATFISIRIPLHASATLEVVASGLANPRGLNFGPEGGLYVAEAGTGGTGPCIVNSNNQFVCYGETGAITRITLGGVPSQARLVTGLPSLAAPPGAAGAGGAALGPHDVEFQGRGNGFVTIGAALDPARRFNDTAHPEFAAVGANVGRLVRFQPNGKWSFAEDLSAFEEAANPDGGGFDSNPFGLLALPGRQVFTDAGGNSLNAVAANGSIIQPGIFSEPYRRYGDIPGGANRRGIGTRRESVRRPADWFSVSTGTGKCLSRAGERRNAGGLRERLHEDHRPHVWIGRFALRSANQLDRRTSSPRRKRIVDPRVTGRDENDDRSSERRSGGAGWHRDRSRRFDLCDELFGLSQRGHGRQGRSVASVPP